MTATPESESPSACDRLMEEVCERENLKQTLKRVKASRGAPGVDGMTVQALPAFLREHWPSITDPNRRVRTRTHCGVGWVGPQGLPLSRLVSWGMTRCLTGARCHRPCYLRVICVDMTRQPSGLRTNTSVNE